MVDDELKDALARGEAKQLHAKREVLFQVERPPRFLVDQFLGGGLRIRLFREVNDPEREALSRIDHLHRLAILEREAGSQRLMAEHDLGERLLECILVYLAAKTKRPRSCRPRSG